MNDATTTSDDDTGIKLAIFDWAGTTVDYGCCAPVLAFMEGFRQHGVPITMAQAREPMGMEKRDHIEAVASMDSVAASWLRIHGKPIGQADIDRLYQAFTPLLDKALVDTGELIPGVIETVQWLRKKNIKVGATTGYFAEAAELVAQSAERLGYRPDFSICATEVSSGRPFPWMIYRVMEKLQICPPEVVVNVGDTVVDVAAGLNAGVWSIGVARTGNLCGLPLHEFEQLPEHEADELVQTARQTLRQAGAHYVIDGVGDLPPVIEEINGRLAQGERP